MFILGLISFFYLLISGYLWYKIVTRTFDYYNGNHFIAANMVFGLSFAVAGYLLALAIIIGLN